MEEGRSKIQGFKPNLSGTLHNTKSPPMAIDTKTSKNWFDRGGQVYARFRPEYPLGLAQFLAEIAPSRDCAVEVDVGCGNGQLTVQLAAILTR